MTIKKNRQSEFTRIASHLLAHKAQYLEVEQRTGVPWYLIAVLHERESSANFGTYLGNGQSLKRRTTIVPKGRGPFTGPNAFVDGAIDALRIDGLTNVRDFRIEKILYYCEQFNGWGSANKGLPSSYIWGGTSVQRSGKWVADHVWNGKVWDTQPGCAAILLKLSEMDNTIHFVREV